MEGYPDHVHLREGDQPLHVGLELTQTHLRLFKGFGDSVPLGADTRELFALVSFAVTSLLGFVFPHKVPFGVLLFDSWYLADELVSMARYYKKDWVSLLKKNRNLETNSFVLKDAAGNPIRLEGPHIAVEDLVPLIPPTAYRAVTVGDKTYWTFTLAVRLPGWAKSGWWSASRTRS